MKPHLLRWACWAFAAVLTGSVALHAQAQQRAATRTGNTSSGLGSTARQYLNNTMVGEAMITSDPETRRLIVITDEETNLHVSQVISNLDRPKPQVLIKVVFLEVTHRDDLDVGVEGTYTKASSTSTNTVGTSMLGLFGGPLAAFGNGGFYRFQGEDVEVAVRALALAGKTEVLSRPSILARNNQQATIIVGEEVPLITNTRFDTLGNQINTIQYQDIGIILRVTPFITADGMVEMIVAPEISNLTDKTVPISGGTDPVSAPVIAKRAADTVVVTPDGSTVVIGGLMGTQKTQADRKVPILGDIPGLGLLFKRTIRSSVKTELLIFLTPYVVPEPRELARMTATEAGKTEMAPKTFTPSQLDRYLDGLPLKQPKPTKTLKSPPPSN